MSYPKNAATPPRIAVGAVVQISDGAVQTSGVSIRVVPQGGSAAAGLGTTTYEDGVVLYAPTQAETNYDAFVIIAHKTGCIPATTTVVTSDTATAGRVRLSGITHVDAVIPTVTTVANRVSANTDQWGGVAVTGMPMPTYTQPTGFLAATFPTTVASPTTPLDASGTAAAVWDAVMASYTTAGTFGGRIVRSTSSNNSVAITGTHHVAAVIHELQPAVITAAAFDLGALDANALAADAAAEIASAVRINLATELGRIDAATSTRAIPADIPSAITIADAVLSRSVATVESSAAEHTLCTLVLAALEGAISGNTWTIKRSNGSTTHYVKTVTADANASPIVSVQ